MHLQPKKSWIGGQRVSLSHTKRLLVGVAVGSFPMPPLPLSIISLGLHLFHVKQHAWIKKYLLVSTGV